MSGLLIGLITYFSLLFLWSVLNIVVFAISYLRKANYLKGFDVLNSIIMYLIQIGIILWGLGIVWSFFSNKEWLLLFLAFMFGGMVIGFYQMFYYLLQAPFIFLTKHLSEKLDKSKKEPWQEYEAEILTPEGKVVGTMISDDKVNKRLSFWFLAVYFLTLISYFLDSGTDRNWAWGDYIIMPVVFMSLFSLPIMLIYAVWNGIRYKKILPKGKRFFVANTLRILCVLLIILLVMNFLFV